MMKRFGKKVILLAIVSSLLLIGLLAACGEVATSVVVAPTVTPGTTQAVTTAAAPTSAAGATTAPIVVPPTVTSAATSAATIGPTTSAPIVTTSPTATATSAPPVTPTPAATVLTVPSGPSPTTVVPRNSLAFIAEGSLWRFDPVSGTKTGLFQAQNGAKAVGRIAWATDGLIAFAVQTKADGPTQLYIINPATPETKTIVPAANSASDSEPNWSADGKLLAFTRKAGGKSEIWVAARFNLTPRKLANGQYPVFAPDSRRIAFLTEGTIKPGLAAPQGNALHLINDAGENEWEPINVAKIPQDLTSLGYPFNPDTFALQSPTWLDGGKTLAFTAQGHSGLVITINSSTGKDLKFWDTAHEGGFGMTDSVAGGSMLAFQAYPPSGTPSISLINTAGKPDLTKPVTMSVGGASKKAVALYPALNETGTQLAYFKLSGASGSEADLKDAKGSLMIAQLVNGKLEEKELLKTNVQSIAWLK